MYATFGFNGEGEKQRTGDESVFLSGKEKDECRLLGLDRARTTEVYLKRDATCIDEERAGRKIIEVYRQGTQRRQKGDEQTGCEESENEETSK